MENVNTPINAEALRELLNDPVRVAKLMKEGKLSDIVDDYAKVATAEGDLDRRMAAAGESALAHRLSATDNVKRLPMSITSGSGVRGAWQSDDSDIRLPKVVGSNGFGNGGEFLKSIFHRNIQTAGIDARLKDLSINVGADGGFLVPDVMAEQLMSVPIESTVVMNRARVIPMDTQEVSLPAIRDTSHASSVFGGLIAYWSDENAAITESQPEFSRVKLIAHKLAVYTEVPNELFGDAVVSLEAFLNHAFGEAIAFFMDDAFINGGGGAEPLGVLNSGALIAVTRGTTNEVNYVDVANIYSRMVPSSLGNAVWVCSPAVWPQLAQMEVSAGGGGVWIPNAQGQSPGTLFGRPVIISEKLADLGTQGDILFADFSHYLVGQRQGVTMATSPHFKFQNDQTVIRGTTRVDGRPWLDSALTPKNGGSTLSPFVTLAA